jgi:hypothetical protein
VSYRGAGPSWDAWPESAQSAVSPGARVRLGPLVARCRIPAATGVARNSEKSTMPPPMRQLPSSKPASTEIEVSRRYDHSSLPGPLPAKLPTACIPRCTWLHAHDSAFARTPLPACPCGGSVSPNSPVARLIFHITLAFLIQSTPATVGFISLWLLILE